MEYCYFVQVNTITKYVLCVLLNYVSILHININQKSKLKSYVLIHSQNHQITQSNDNVSTNYHNSWKLVCISLWLLNNQSICYSFKKKKKQNQNKQKKFKKNKQKKITKNKIKLQQNSSYVKYFTKIFKGCLKFWY